MDSACVIYVIPFVAIKNTNCEKNNLSDLVTEILHYRPDHSYSCSSSNF